MEALLDTALGVSGSAREHINGSRQRNLSAQSTLSGACAACARHGTAAPTATWHEASTSGRRASARSYDRDAGGGRKERRRRVPRASGGLAHSRLRAVRATCGTVGLGAHFGSLVPVRRAWPGLR